MTSGELSAESDKRSAILDAAERIMCKHGYAAVTSREVAEVANTSVLHYYFSSLDDLFTDLLRRVTDAWRRLDAVASSKSPIEELWKFMAPEHVTLTCEFVALVNHRKVLRAELASVRGQIRMRQCGIVAHALRQVGHLEGGPRMAIVIAMEDIARSQITGAGETQEMQQFSASISEFVRTIGALRLTD